jgi:hypothetical protein
MRKVIAHSLVGLAVIGAFAAGSVTTARADQPHMQSALDHLQAARSELVQATADKGGHRAAAIRFTDQAINQTRMGIRFDRRI